MNLARASVRRPVFTSMVMLMVMVLGAVALTRLQTDLLPSIELPTLTVRTQYEGADPVVMERLVTQIVEEIVATVPGVEEITSTSTEGSSSVRVRFGWGTDIDTAAVDVRATLEDERSELPDDIVGPRVSKFDVDSYPVLVLGISSQLPPVQLTELLEEQIRYRLARIPGVAQVDPWGGYNREVRVELDPERLNALQLPINDILTALRDANLDLPAGKLEQGGYEVTLRAPAEFSDLDQILQTAVGRQDGQVVRLGQIARVLDTYEKLNRFVRIDGELGLRLAIRKQADANTVDVAQRVLDEVATLNRTLPQVRITAVTNQGNFIELAIANVARSLLYGGILAVLVLLFFLRDLRSTLVISMAIPISVLATFGLLYFGGFTLNLMTLGGLALGVGLMVDSSVVVLENIFRRYREQGEVPAVAAVEGTGEVASAVLAGTLTTLVILVPLTLVQGVSGALFADLAYVVGFSLICALLVALSLVPMLASKLLTQQTTASSVAVLKTPLPDEGTVAVNLDPSDAVRSFNRNDAPGTDQSRIDQARADQSHPHPDSVGVTSRLAAWAGQLFAGMERAYQAVLVWLLGRRWTVLLFTLVLLASSLLLLPRIGTEFLPPSDEGEVRITGEMEVGTRLEVIDAQTRMLEALVFPAVPEMQSSIVSVSRSGSRGSSKATASITLSLVPATERSRSSSQIANELRTLIEHRIPGMTIRVRAPAGQFLLERLLDSEDGIKVEVRGYDLETLDLLARRVQQAVESVEGITDVRRSRESGVPQQEILVDRQKIADLGLSVRDVTEVIQTAVAGSKAGDYRIAGNSYRILVQLQDAERRSIDEILDLTLSTPGGQPVALRNLVRTASGEGPVRIQRKEQQRLVTVSANVAGRDLGSVAAEIEARLGQIARPPGYDMLIAGDFEEQQQAFADLTLSLVLAIALVYMVLASQYESFRDPLLVMLSVPLAAVGVILTLVLTNTTLNLQSAIGCLMLSGIVVNNAILLVDQAGRLRRSGLSANDALLEAGRRRLRPVLMTTLTTVLALLPLALGLGEGADAQAPLARVVVGGLGFSALITLGLIPVVYSLVYQGGKTDVRRLATE